MRRGALGFATLGVALLGTLSGTARADYCRTKACDNHVGYDDVWQSEPDPPCTTMDNGCRIDGNPLYWPHSCLSFAVQQDGSPKENIDYDALHSVILQAFDTWMSADCGGSTPSLRIDDFSPAVCDHPEYNTDQGNANVFMFRDDNWPHQNAEDTLALTTITYNRENAQIFDADVEINSFQGDFTNSDDISATRDDLLAVLTHETGHFLGLSHDTNPQATMYAYYSRQEPYQQRDLHPNDVEGICAIYPPDAPVSQSECVPRHGFMRTCAVEQTTSGCNVAPGANGAGAAGLFAALGLLGSLRRRARRRGSEG